MESMREKIRPKHQALILKCFPRYQKGVLDVKPNGSELSYLLYYASTRRSKLQKVGAYLEKKAARDVSRGRIGNVQVLLQIVTALIEKLPRELPLYGQSVLNILETVLRSNDLAMVEETLRTFEIFCVSQDLAVLAAEQRYATQYENIIRNYAEFASSKSRIQSKIATTSIPIRMRWKNIGLKAIKSMVGSDSLSSDGGKQLSVIMPVILENVYDGGEDLLKSLGETGHGIYKLTSEERKGRRSSTATVRTVNTAEEVVAEASGTTADADKLAETEVQLLAMKCLERIFIVSNNRPQIRTAASLVLQFIVSRNASSKTDQSLRYLESWSTSIMDIITKWCPVQHRFIILFTAVETLRGIAADGQPIGQQILVALLIDSLLKSPVNMIGLSVIDVLIGFIQQILRLLQPSNQLTHADLGTSIDFSASSDLKQEERVVQEDPALSADHAKFVSLLKQCIADLATHNYYADQISDMVSTLLNRIRPLTPSDVVSGAIKTTSESSISASDIPGLTGERQAENYFYSSASQVVALEAIKNILVVANQGKITTSPGIESRNKVSLQAWEGTNWLLRDSNRGVRNAYAEAFVSWLELETTKTDLKVPDVNNRLSRARSKREPDGYKRNTSSALVDKTQAPVSSVFLQLLHLTLYETAVEYAEVQEDILVVYIMLFKLVRHLGVNAVRFGLPMILKLQGESSGSATSQIHIGSLVYGFLATLSNRFGLEASPLGTAIQGEITRRQNNGTWLETVQIPPIPMSEIETPVPHQIYDSPDLQDPLRSFSAVEDLVKQIEEAYVASLSAHQSPPGSPVKQATTQVPEHAYFEKHEKLMTLPADVKGDMLSTWSKEACIAVLEKEKAAASSVAESRNGNSGRRSHRSQPLNGYGNQTPNDGGSPTSLGRNKNHTTTTFDTVPGSSSSSRGYRRDSNRADGSPGVSSRDSTIRVNDLKKMLTVTGNSNVRRSSPLRGRLDAGNESISTSSSESFVSGTFSASDFDTESRPQSIREGSETPKSVPTTTANSSNHSITSGGDYDDDNIPPVPPLPLGLTIPGGFPDNSATDLSRQSSSAQNRPGGSIKSKSTRYAPLGRSFERETNSVDHQSP